MDAERTSVGEKVFKGTMTEDQRLKLRSATILNVTLA